VVPGLVFMSFLDNLESNLKSLEGNSERDSVLADRRRQQSEKARALAAAPYAEELRKGEFTAELLNHATRIGFGQRTKVNMVWIGTSLRLDAKERRLELKPTAEGVVAVFSESGDEKAVEPVDLKGDPEKLAKRWLVA
jgi:hypothetical protein